MKVSKEIKIALVAILAIVLLYFGMNFLKGMSLFTSNNRYFIAFKDVTGKSARHAEPRQGTQRQHGRDCERHVGKCAGEPDCQKRWYRPPEAR